MKTHIVVLITQKLFSYTFKNTITKKNKVVVGKGEPSQAMLAPEVYKRYPKLDAERPGASGNITGEGS